MSEGVKTVAYLSIAASALLLIVCVAIAARREKFTTRKIVMIAMLTAVYVILCLVGTIRLWWMNISVATLPLIIASLLFGPVGGLLVGLLGSFLEQLLSYGLMATTVLWLVPNTVRGLLLGVYFRKLNYRPTCAQLIGALVIAALITTALNTLVMYLDSVVQGYYSYAYVFGGVVTRVIAGVITAVVMAFVAPPVVGLLERTLQGMKKN